MVVLQGRRALLLLTLAVAVPLAAPGQQVAAARDAMTFQSFDKRGGLLPSTVYSVVRDRAGLLWIGSEEGAAYFTGHAWRRVAIPSLGRWNAVRIVLPLADGTLWFASRVGAIRIRGADTTRFGASPGGLADDNLYDLRETTIFGGRQLLAASRDGLARFDGNRFHAVPLPPGLVPHGMVTLETQVGDSVPSLWVATPNVGLWRLRAGRWQRFGAEQGLGTTSVEAIVPALPRAGPGPVFYAAGEDGVFAFDGVRFDRVAGSPRGAFRLLELERADGQRELWVGTTDGLLTRRLAGGSWEEVQAPTIERGTPIMSLTALPRPGEDPVVWVGFKAERLTRIQLTQALHFPLPTSLPDRQITMVRTVHLGDRTEYWIGTRQPGVLRVTREGSRFDATDPSLGLGRVRSITRIGDTLWVAGDEGVAAWTAAGWRRASQGLGSTVLRRFARAETADGQQFLYGGAQNGIWQWKGQAWERLDLPVVGAIADLVQVRGVDGTAVLWVAAEGGQVWRVHGRNAVPTVPTTTGIGRAEVLDLSVQALPGGGQRLWAATAGLGGLRYLDLDAPTPEWRSISEDLQEAMPSDFVRDLALGPHGRLFAATPRGLAQLRVIAADSIALETVYGQDEGLPSSDVYKIESDAGTGALLVGTNAGLGWLRPVLPGAEHAAPLRLVARSGASGVPLRHGATLAHDEAAVTLDFSLLNYVREGETRYRTRLVGGGETLSPWSALTTVSLGALAPGRYRFEVWARDYRGQVTGPATYAFEVTPPWWVTPPAMAAYLVAAVAALWWLVRWRTDAVRRRAQELEVRERLARASERRFRALFDRAFDAHLLVDGEVIAAANDAAHRLFGVASADDLVGRPLAPLVPASVLRGGPEGPGPQETEVQRVDGGAVPVQVAPIVIPLEDGGTMLHLVLRDLSEAHRAAAERQQLEDQVRETQKIESLGTLAGGIAHDFNNLLTVIRANAELLLDRTPPDAPAHGPLESVREAANRARELVRQILTFSRRSPRAQATVSLQGLVRELEQLLRPTLPSTVRMEITLPDQPLMVVGDLTQLQQMLLNLCVNAEYAMRERGGVLAIALEEISVSGDGIADHPTLRPGRHARLRVRDTGTGIAPEVLPRIFEPFFTTKPVGEGTGLGLSVLHGIVASHAGSVHVETEVDRGTTIEVLLPLSERPVRDASPVAASPPPAVIGARVLLVDDDAAVLSVTTRLLERLGYTVTACDSGPAALRHLEAHRDEVDIVLTDQTMPGMTGDRLLGEVKRIRPELPVVIITGFSHLLTPERVATLGAAAVLAKPVDRGDLVAALNAALTPQTWS